MNSFSEDKVVGVLGGMGPEATADFYSKLLRLTPASCDQEHLRVIIDSNGKVPDRVKAILHGGEDPAPILKKMALGLVSIGADLIVIPCNTAHYYYNEIQSAVDVPVLHLQQIVFDAIKTNYSSMHSVGLLATVATIETGLYQRFAEKAGITLVIPTSLQQDELVTGAIREVKSGNKEQGRSLIKQAANDLVAMGAEAIIAGCTEIPLILNSDDLSVPVFDSTLLLAEATLRSARA